MRGIPLLPGTMRTSRNIGGPSNDLLWGDKRYADLCLIVEFTETQSLPGRSSEEDVSLGGVESDSESATNAGDITGTWHAEWDRGVGNESPNVGDGTPNGVFGAGTVGCCSSGSFSKMYHLHGGFLACTSASFYASLATDEGDPSFQKAPSVSDRRWHLRAEMCAEDADAVEAVLLSLYQQPEFDKAASSDLLLRIIKVWASAYVDVIVCLMCTVLLLLVLLCCRVAGIGTSWTFPFQHSS